MMDELPDLLGKEIGVEDTAHTLRHTAQRLGAGTVGALQLTCADESEYEAAEAFRRHFVWHVLPPLKFGNQTAFRLATLGSRYEWGSAQLAEQHYATPESAKTFKLMVFKVNAHVSRDADMKYGRMQRYHVPSYYCGALRSLLDGKHGPALDDLRHTFGSEGRDRVKLIRDSVPEGYRPLAAAIVNARLQARKAVIEIQDFEPATPTLYQVLAAVTLNRPDYDTELLVGRYLIDRRKERSDVYQGLGDDPSRYRFDHPQGRLKVEDDDLGRPREARDHREMIGEAWRAAKPRAPQAFEETRKKRLVAGAVKPLLKAAVLSLAEVAAVPAALFLFAEGLVGIHHAWRAHRLAKDQAAHAEANEILREFEQRLDHLPPERAHAILESLMREYPEA